MSEQDKDYGLLSDVRAKAFSKAGLIVIGAVVFVVILGSGGSYVWAQQFQNRLGPNVSIAGLDVSGMDPDMARQHVQSAVDQLLTDGVDVTFENQTKTLPLTTFVTDNVIDHVHIDVEGAVERALQASHVNHPISDTVLKLQSFVNPVSIEPSVEIVKTDSIIESLRSLFPEEETFAVNAGFEIEEDEDAWKISVTSATDGNEFATENLLEALSTSLTDLSSRPAPITVAIETTPAEVQMDDAEALLEEAQTALENAPYELTHEPPGRTLYWNVTESLLVSSLSAERTKNGSFQLTLRGESFDTFLETLEEDVYVEPRNAKFEIVDGKVSEFVGSIPGTELDRDATTAAIESLLNDTPEQPVAVAVLESAPEVVTADVNDLGITELLGVGISDYSNSPPNRISNIRNAVRLLNGTLIAPDETFSLVEALHPFTYENGFLPELVIKGDKIEPEMGGGACQIGTTTFRATMNAGLPVTERRNHSLVVDHYNDPLNGNPGTDATIYEVNGKGAPDYKFTNDTGHYVLFQAEMLEESEELRFTFWGTSDGRKGSYTPPVVHRWIGAGAQKEVKTTDLAPGQRKCQSSFAGAEASFTYTVENPDGTVDEQVFESHYRALPSICLVGVTEEELNGEVPDELTEEEQEAVDEILEEESEDDSAEDPESLEQTEDDTGQTEDTST